MSISQSQALLVICFAALGLHALAQLIPASNQVGQAQPSYEIAGRPQAVIKPESLSAAYPQTLWPKVNGVATVYYVIDSASDPNATPNIKSAISTFNADFPGIIQWVAWKSTHGPNYVDINLSSDNRSGACEASEGYEAVPAQPMAGSTTCTITTILHEMGHVIGLWHEQSRSDRNTYITVNYSNVIKGSWGNFDVLADNRQILSPYDYASVMQYPSSSFSRNGGPVIETIPAGMPLQGSEGVPVQANPDYSAGDKETIERLYGAPPKSVTVTSNPIGLQVTVDGATVTTPATYSWTLGSTHTLSVPDGVQTLTGSIANSTTTAPYYYTYGRWNNSTEQTQAITVTGGSGSLAFPNNTPAVATYSANFIQLVPYTASVYPTTTGTVAVSPTPKTYSGATGEFFVARQEAKLSATAASGWSFYEFNNAPYWLPGGLGENPKTFYVPDTGNPVDTTAEFTDTPVYTVDIAPETFSSNLYAYIDGNFWYTPKNFSSYYDSAWTTGSTHTLSLGNPEYPYSFNSRYAFSKWSDGGALSHTTAPLTATNTKFLATVTPQFAPATNFSYPPCGGSATLSPASPTNDGFYPTGQVLTLTATPDNGWSFAGWTYDLTGTTNPDTLTATGFTDGSLVAANGEYRKVTYINPETLEVPLTSADVANPRAFQVFVENFPSGWDGCAVFGYQTFLVNGSGKPAPAVATPTFSPSSGAYSSKQTVTIGDTTSGAAIYYTINGTTPTTASTLYTGPITVSASEKIEAVAAELGYNQSAVGAASYTFKAPTPTISPDGGTFTVPPTVTIADPLSGSTIYYTTNGTTPNTSSSVYAGPIAVSESEKVEAIAVVTGYAASSTASATFTLKDPTPTFSPAGGTYTSAQTVTIGDALAGATIYYTTNGTTPTASSTLYTGPLAVSATQKIEAVAVTPGWTTSSTGSASYTIK